MDRGNVMDKSIFWKHALVCPIQGKCAFTRRQPGFSLLEIIIAFSIVVVFALGIIQVLRQSGMKGETFSSEHFTAMFLSQKVLEDINHRVVENPHYFTKLIHTATGAKKPIVDGQHPFFRLLENTSNFTWLDSSEDKPISSDSGSIYQQLKNFQAQVETGFVVDPSTGQPFQNLIEVRIRIFWKDPVGNEQSYAVNQMISGLNEDALGGQVKAQLPPISDDKIGKTLWDSLASEMNPSSPTLNAFLALNHGDADVVKAFGSLLYAVQVAASLTITLNDEISNAESRRNSALAAPDAKTKNQAALWQEKICDAYEKKSGLMFSLQGSIQPALAGVASRSLSAAAIGSILSSKIHDLRVAAVDGIALIERLQLNLTAGDEAFTKLLNPPYRALIEPRKVNPIVRRMLDIKKMRALMESLEGKSTDRLTDLQKTVQLLQSNFAGHEPAFLEYLYYENTMVQSPNKLCAHYGANDGLTAVTARIMGMPSLCENIEASLRGIPVTGIPTLPSTTASTTHQNDTPVH
ncbi:MAG: hypothetical protein HQM09_04235 [Candidatus Riflebacteria bacterium]|nr:hypothetical protein [Candidatus Riflebacteria bacterium]